MKSKAHIKGHSLHPILVAFPIAFLSGALIFDVLGYFNQNSSFWATASYLEIAGLIAGCIAAIPGSIDYFFTVPPRSSAKSRASKHALINVGMLLLFLIAFINRHHEFSIWVIGLETAGVILILIAGWMGGTLVIRNQIGINPRYARAGKWKEERFRQDSGRIEVAGEDELEVDQMKLLHFPGKRVVLARTEEQYVAFDDHCPHKGGSLAGGAMMCGTVQCPWHGSQFDVKNGSMKAGPAETGIKTYTVYTANGKVYVDL